MLDAFYFVSFEEGFHFGRTRISVIIDFEEQNPPPQVKGMVRVTFLRRPHDVLDDKVCKEWNM